MKKLDLTKLQNAEHFALMTDVVNLLKEANIPQLGEVKSKIETLVADEDAAQQQIRKSEHTETLTSLDEKRDKLYRGLVLRLQSEQFSPDEAKATAANKLMIVVNTYGNFTAHNYQKETAEIYNLVQDFKSENLQSVVESAGIKEWVQWLETANNDFNNLFTNRRDEYAAQPVYDLKNIRKELDAQFHKLQQTLQAMQILSPSDVLTVLISKLDASIQKWKDTLAQRSGTNKPNAL